MLRYSRRKTWKTWLKSSIRYDPCCSAINRHYRQRMIMKGIMDLWSVRDLVIEGRKRKEVFFAGLIIQKSYVGFYYMPVYAEPEVKQLFKPELLRLLKGKSCFHIRKVTPELLAQIQDALAQGFERYKLKGWV